MSIQYVDRSTGKLQTEKVYGSRALSLLYGDSWVAFFFSRFLLPFLARIPLFSQFYGFLQRQPSSRKKIAPFIETYGVDASEFEQNSFNSFNDFFIRKLKKECRPIIQDPKVASMPADGRYLAFEDVGQVGGFFVKGRLFDLSSFLKNDPYARRFSSGSMVIARLCPTDYHRFHFICDGVPTASKMIDGSFYSVNPIALKKKFSTFWENKRAITEIETDLFGKVLYVEVGATCVGTIHQTYQPEKRVLKGDEKGYFSFGGSCLVILFEKGKILLDADLIENTKKGFETKALFGESLGKI